MIFILRNWVIKLRNFLVKRGYERIKNFTLENYAKQWENVIKAALKY